MGNPIANGIILTLDSNLDAIIRNIWQRFEQGGIGKTPGQFGEPPHITFAGSSTCTLQGLVETIEDTNIENTEVTLVPFGVFPGRESVIYLNAILSEDLRLAHVSHYKACRSKGIELNPLYAPGRIIFHCTIAVEIGERDYLPSMKMISSGLRPSIGRADKLEIWEYFPAMQKYSRELGRSS